MLFISVSIWPTRLTAMIRFYILCFLFRFLDVSYFDGQEQSGAIVKLPLSNGDLQTATVVENVLLTSPEAVKAYMDIEIRLESAFLYQPGDTVGVVCRNTDQDVALLVSRLGIEERLDSLCQVSILKGTTKSRAKIPEHIPGGVSVNTLLYSNLDIRSVPKKLFLRSLIEVTENPVEKRRLEELCSKQVSISIASLKELYASISTLAQS